MVEVLNSLGVHCACVGNHDLDFGVQNMELLISQCSFPWLLANIMDKHTGVPRILEVLEGALYLSLVCFCSQFPDQRLNRVRLQKLGLCIGAPQCCLTFYFKNPLRSLSVPEFLLCKVCDYLSVLKYSHD